MSKSRWIRYHLTGKSCGVLVYLALLVAIFSGNVDIDDMVASVTWPCQLPPGWTVKWDPSSVGKDRGE